MWRIPPDSFCETSNGYSFPANFYKGATFEVEYSSWCRSGRYWHDHGLCSDRRWMQ
jgi:hypothetical protein